MARKHYTRPPQDEPTPVSNKTLDEAVDFFRRINDEKEDMNFLHPEHDKGAESEKKTIVPDRPALTRKSEYEAAPYEPTHELKPKKREETTPRHIEPEVEHLEEQGDAEGWQEFTYQEPVQPKEVQERRVEEQIAPVLDEAPAREDLPEDYLEQMEHDPLPEQFAKALKADPIPPKAQLCIAQYSEQYTSARDALSRKDSDSANDHYHEMLRHYQTLKDLAVPEIHKHIAHHGLEEIYDQLKLEDQGGPISKRTFVTMLAASVLVMIVGVTLVLNPSLSGLAVLEQQIPHYTGPHSFEIFGPRKIELADQFGIAEDKLSFLATRSTHVDAQVDGSSIVVIPDPGFRGEETISVMAINTGVQPYRVEKVRLEMVVR